MVFQDEINIGMVVKVISSGRIFNIVGIDGDLVMDGKGCWFGPEELEYVA